MLQMSMPLILLLMLIFFVDVEILLLMFLNFCGMQKNGLFPSESCFSFF